MPRTEDEPRFGTYGEEWRARARYGGELDADEQRMWLEEQLWEDANLQIVLWLEKHVGRVVATTRPLECVNGDHIQADTHFSIRARFRDRLLGESTNLRVLLRLDWIRIVKVAPPRKKTRHRDTDVETHPVRAVPAPDSIAAVSLLLESAASMRTI